MKKSILILGVIINSIICSCSKSDTKSTSSTGTCFECTVENVLIKYCQKDATTATITANGQSEEDTFTSWTQYVTDTKSGVATIGGTCN